MDFYHGSTIRIYIVYIYIYIYIHNIYLFIYIYIYIYIMYMYIYIYIMYMYIYIHIFCPKHEGCWAWNCKKWDDAGFHCRKTKDFTNTQQELAHLTKHMRFHKTEWRILVFAVEILATTTETFKQITSNRLGQTWKQKERSYQEKMGFTLLKPLRDLHNKQPSGKSLSCFLAFSRLTRDMIALRWQLLLLLLVGTTGDEISVVVSKKVFEKRFQGHSYDKWRDFVKAAGEQDNPGGEARLKAGFTLLFAASATVTVGTIIHYVIGKEFAAPCTAWVVILILLMYAAAVFVYCMATYADPAQRVVTNLLFGLVPWCVSCASYLVAVQLVDACRGLRNMTHEPIAEAPEPEPPQSIAWLTGGRRSSSVQDLQLSLEDFSCDLRFGLLLAVLPSLGISIWFTRSYATGFTGVGTFFDVLALCLFVDVWRLVMHTSLLLAPSWTFPKEAEPGQCRRAWLVQAHLPVVCCLACGFGADEAACHWCGVHGPHQDPRLGMPCILCFLFCLPGACNALQRSHFQGASEFSAKCADCHISVHGVGNSRLHAAHSHHFQCDGAKHHRNPCDGGKYPPRGLHLLRFGAWMYSNDGGVDSHDVDVCPLLRALRGRSARRHRIATTQRGARHDEARWGTMRHDARNARMPSPL